MASRLIEFALEIRGNAAAEARNLASAIDRVNVSADAARKTTLFGLGDKLESLGGMINDVPIPGFDALGDVVLSAGNAFQAMASPLGVAILGIGGAAAVSVAGAAAIVGLVSSADDWIAKLEEAGIAPDFIPPEQLAAIEHASAAMADLEIAAQVTGVTLAGVFAEDVGHATTALTGLVSELGTVVAGLEDSGVKDAARSWSRDIAMVLTAGISEIPHLVYDAAHRAGEQAAQTLDTMTGDEMAALLGVEGAGSVDTGLQRRAREAEQAGARIRAEDEKRTKALEAQADALEQLHLATMKATATTTWDELLATQAAELARLQAIADKAGGTAEALALVAEVAASQSTARDAFRVGQSVQADATEVVLGLEGISADLDEISGRLREQRSGESDKHYQEFIQAALRGESDAGQSSGQKLDGIAAGISKVGAALDGGLSGVLTALGPAGAVAGAVLAILPDLSGALDAVMGEALDIIADLPAILEELLSEGIPTILENVDDLIIGIIESLDDIVIALVSSLDDILLALVTLPYELLRGVGEVLLDLGGVIFDAFKAGLEWLWEQIKSLGAAALNPLTGKEGNFLGTNLADGQFFGADISPNDGGGLKLPSFDVGGMIRRSGLANVHAGELIGQPDQLRAMLGRQGGTNVTATIVGDSSGVIREIVRALRIEIGDYGGTGQSLSAFG